MDKDSVFTGLVMGALIPVIGYIAIEFLFDLATQMGWIDAVSASTSERRLRTIFLLSICTNLIPFHVAKYNKWDNTMRGVVFPTLIYVGFWIYTFYESLF